MQNGSVNYQANQSLRLFGQACVGVAIGVLLALAFARLLLPPDGPAKTMPEGLLSWNLHNILLKPREKGFYLLALVLGGVCGYAASYRILSERAIAVAIWVSLLISVPLFNVVIGKTLSGQSTPSLIFALLITVAALIAGRSFALLMLARGQPLAMIARWPTERDKDFKQSLWPFFLILGIVTLILIPSSFEAVAARIGLNFHPVSFVFGPALYFLGHNLLPGIDYYSQYGIGLPWLFHFVMGRSADQAVITYTIIVILATWAFYAHLIYLLGWLYRSWIAAGVVAVIPLILAFAHPAEFPAQFFAPSSTVLRYPLLTVCAVLTALWSESPNSLWRLLVMALAAATSTFLETETGIVMTVTAPLVLFLVHPWRSYIIIPIVGFLVATITIFIAELFAVLGPGILQPLFFHRMFEAIFYFAADGFGGWPINWTLKEWTWLYNLVVPGALLATLAVIARSCGANLVDRRRAAVLGFLAASGLMLLFKYVNQSLVGVWQMSAIGPFSILGWWCMALLKHIDPAILLRRVDFDVSREMSKRQIPRMLSNFTASLRNDVALVMVTLALLFLYSPSEARNPGTYGLRAWAKYASLLKWPFSKPKGCVRMSCVPNRPAPSDVALIDSRTRPGQQVAIVVDLYDWAYLIDAHRPPLMLFVPSATIFTEVQYQESLRRLRKQEYIFTPKDSQGRPYFFNTVFDQTVSPLLGTDFNRDGEGERLIAWKRRSAQPLSAAH